MSPRYTPDESKNLEAHQEKQMKAQNAKKPLHEFEVNETVCTKDLDLLVQSD